MVNLTKHINQFVVKLGLANSNCDYPKTIVCNEFPSDNFAEDTIYILGEKNYLYTAAFTCACRNGHIAYLNLHQDEHPFWKVKFHLNGTVTINPSIWYKKGCRSHYFIHKGKIINI